MASQVGVLVNIRAWAEGTDPRVSWVLKPQRHFVHQVVLVVGKASAGEEVSAVGTPDHGNHGAHEENVHESNTRGENSLEDDPLSSDPSDNRADCSVVRTVCPAGGRSSWVGRFLGYTDVAVPGPGCTPGALSGVA